MSSNFYKKYGEKLSKQAAILCGGFFKFYCPDNTRYNVTKELLKLGCKFRRYRFTNLGAESWTVK